jgi:hypothetical protein
VTRVESSIPRGPSAPAHGPRRNGNSAGAAILFVLFSLYVEDISLSPSKHRPTVQGWSANEVIEDDGDDTYQPFACVACTRGHLVNLKTGKVLGEGAASAALVDRRIATAALWFNQRGLDSSRQSRRVPAINFACKSAYRPATHIVL